MIANSEIFTSTVFGTSSGMTAKEMSDKNRTTQESFLAQNSASSLRTQMPRVPSNQRIAKDK
jgi:hypothetical protein